MTSFGTRIRGALRRANSKSPAQRYLEGAVSMVDLELREREIDRGRLVRSGFTVGTPW